MDQPVNGAMDVDKPDAKPSAPVTRTGPESGVGSGSSSSSPAEPVALLPSDRAPPAAAIAQLLLPLLSPARCQISPMPVLAKAQLEGEADAKIDAGLKIRLLRKPARTVALVVAEAKRCDCDYLEWIRHGK